jgi:predicted RNase H-like nuclease/ppGpp synthetase/RelA/SpoT-type nucleotidyltranferase
VHYLGIDLAWGLNRPTGLAVLDDAGRLLHLAAVRTDDEIAESLAPFAAGPCLAGIDAPLVVTNSTGSRPAEKALSKDFRRYDAGTHPSNTGKPEFAGGTRGAVVCDLLGLDLDPDSTAERRAIEVYPHPATVVLFGLERTLKYKQKKGRDLELLRGELLTLMDHVERLVDTGGPDDPWAARRAAVVAATRKSELRVTEDQVDAVVCAYVALFADRWPERTTRYGDLETGYIVTPSLVTDVAAAAVREYAADHARLEQAGRAAVDRVVGILDEAGINYLSVAGRAKSVASFAEKASRTRDGRLLYPDPLRDIGDLLGVRVITFVAGDVEVVASLLADQLVVRDDRDLGELTASEGRFGYASRHLQVEIDGREVQVQLRTVLQHAWAEFEHDIRYKGSVPPEHASEFDRRFTLAAGLLELADQEFSAIRDRLRGPAPAAAPDDAADDDPRIAPRELAAFLAGQYPDAGWSRTDHYAWISGLLLELGIESLAELAEVLRGTDDAAIQQRMAYRYPPAAVRRLDDALLTAYGDRYVALRGNDHRRSALETRREKLTG